MNDRWSYGDLLGLCQESQTSGLHKSEYRESEEIEKRNLGWSLPSSVERSELVHKQRKKIWNY